MSAEDEPVIKFVAGNPTEEEVAAVVAVLTRRRTTTALDAPTGWAGYWRRARRPLRPGPGAWRRSLRQETPTPR